MGSAYWTLTVVTAVALLASPVGLAEESLANAQDAAGVQMFWRPHTPKSDGSLFGALGDFGRRSEEDRLLRSRGLIRPLHFRYKNFTYERDYFHLYKGFRLHSFLDGKVDVGLYKHNLYLGLTPGPAGAFLPSSSKRLELMIRWNLNQVRTR